MKKVYPNSTLQDSIFNLTLLSLFYENTNTINNYPSIDLHEI